MGRSVQVFVSDDLWEKMQEVMKSRDLSAYGLAKEAIVAYLDAPTTPPPSALILDIKADMEEFGRMGNTEGNVSWIEGRYHKSRREARAILAEIAGVKS